MTNISTKGYQIILKEVQFFIELTWNKISRSKIEMAWNIGKIIEENLPQSDRDRYGKKLLESLEQDTSISRSALYRMCAFYRTYPTLPKDNQNLNWSHYRVLSGIKNSKDRNELERKVKQKLWNVKRLEKEVQKHRALQCADEKDLKQVNKKIQPTRGKVFTYKITQIDGSEKYFFDCGFRIYHEIKDDILKDAKMPKDTKMVLVKKDGDKYSLEKSDSKSTQVYTYRAFLHRVVDGETIRANIDLGFGIFHEGIIRLAKINSPEIKCKAGQFASKELEKILKSVPFFILKSIKTDIFNRYVADIFLPESQTELDYDLQSVADEGAYLNQILLDEGLAEVY